MTIEALNLTSKVKTYPKPERNQFKDLASFEFALLNFKFEAAQRAMQLAKKLNRRDHTFRIRVGTQKIQADLSFYAKVMIAVSAWGIPSLDKVA